MRLKAEFHFKGRKIIRICILLLLILTIGSGCFDDEDIDKLMIISPIGIDASPDHQMTVIFRYPLITPGGSLGNHGDSNKQNYILRYATSDGIISALIDAQNRDEHSITFSQCRAIVFGETVAKNGLRPDLDFFSRLPTFPPNAYIVIARPSAADIMAIDWPETELHDQNIRLFFSNRDNAKFGIKKWCLTQRIVDPFEDPAVPIITPSDGNTTMKMAGMAVFRKDRMVGELNAEESSTFALIRFPTPKNRLVIPVAGPISTGFEVITGKKSLKASYRNNHPVFDFKFRLYAYLIELSPVKGILDSRRIAEIEQISARYIGQRILALLRKLQALQSDPLELSNNLRVQQPRIFSLKRWPGDYRRAEFKVMVRLFIERPGILK